MLRKPPWLKVPPPYARSSHGVRATLAAFGLHTVCREAACPNMAECFESGTATFLILGNICTRDCLYCNVASGIPAPVDESETDRLIHAVCVLNLRYVVITSVTRDDLQDGGASVFAHTIRRLRREVPVCRIEVLIPDFQGDEHALACVIDAAPDVINHNMEATLSHYPLLRPNGDYARSLRLLAQVSRSPIPAKSGFMVGFGETYDDVSRLIDDLACVSCARLTIGQYQQPTRNHWPVACYYTPEAFAELKALAYKKGFQHVESGPLVRSSYHAAQAGTL